MSDPAFKLRQNYSRNDRVSSSDMNRIGRLFNSVRGEGGIRVSVDSKGGLVIDGGGVPSGAENYGFRVVRKDDTHVTVQKGYVKGVGAAYAEQSAVDLEVTGSGAIYITYTHASGAWSAPLFSTSPPADTDADIRVYVLADITTTGSGETLKIASIYPRTLGDLKEPVCDDTVPNPITSGPGLPGTSMRYARVDHTHHGDMGSTYDPGGGGGGGGGGVNYIYVTTEGKSFYIETLDVEVCVDGEMETHRFLVADREKPE